MSKDNFDDTLLDDYDTEAGVVENENQDSGSDKKGSLLMGLAIGIAVTIVLELGVGLALDVQNNLVHRYVAYMLGLVPIFIAAVFTRSVLKMVFFVAPTLILASFGLPFFFPDIFSGLMTPFLTLLPIIKRANNILAGFGQIDASTQNIFDLVQQYGIALDFLFGVFVGLCAAVGLTGVVKLVSQKPGLLSIFTIIFSLVFLLIGVIILPYFLVITSGIAHFTMSLGVGGAIMGQGTTISTDPDGNLTQANLLFAESEEWFSQSEAMLKGLQQLGLFNFIGSANPNIQIIVDNGVVLMNAAVDLAQGLAPAMAGFGAISQGMSQAMGSLNSSADASLLVLSQEGNEFDEGIELIEQGFKNFTQAVPQIKEALDTITNDVNRDELTAALEESGGASVNEQINMIFTAVPLLDITLDIFTNSELGEEDRRGLLDDPDGIDNDDQRAPLVHLLLGAKAMSDVQKIIGDNSNFKGTGPYFRDMTYHLSFVTDALNASYNPAVADLENYQVEENTPDAILDLKDKIDGSVNFLKDSSRTAISVGQFGSIGAPTMTAMNQTIRFLTESEDFTQIPSSEYDNAVNIFEGNSTFTPGIISNVTTMQERALEFSGFLDNMEITIAEKGYGFFNTPAKDFVSEFRGFNLTKNANNFYHISTGFNSLVKGMDELTVVDRHVSNIEGNVSIIVDRVEDAELSAQGDSATETYDNITLAQFALGDVVTSINNANSTLQPAKSHIYNASTSFTNTEDMPQLDTTGQSLASIAAHMENIQVGDGTNGGLTAISGLIQDIDSNIVDIQNALVDDSFDGTEKADVVIPAIDAINTDLTGIDGELTFIAGEFAGIQSDLGGISIDA